MNEWNKYFEELDTHGGVNLNVFWQYHRKSSLWNGASLGISIEVNEVIYLYLEEDECSNYRWQIASSQN
jgi:uncharacterized protein YneR